MIQYRIQNLLNLLQPYIKANNPNHDVLQAEYIAWIEASSFLSDAHKMAWKCAELPLFMSRTFPDSNVEPLRISVEYMMDLLLIEQLTDAPATTTQARKWTDIFIQALKQTLSEVEGPAAIIKHLTDRVLSAVKDPHKSYLVASNILLAEGIVKEAADRENPAAELTLEAYTKIRRDTIGLRPFLDIGRWIQDIDISPEILKHSDVAKLEELTIDLVFLANDLYSYYSYRKEFFESGAYHNYVTIALEDPITGIRGNDRQGAIDYTVRKFSEILADFHRRKETLPSFGESEDAKIALYIGVMMDLIVGNIQWSLSCGRYGHIEKAGTSEAPNWGDVVFDMEPL